MTSTNVVVVGFDDSPPGRAALREGADLATRLGGSLHVVHAVPLLNAATAASGGLGGEGYVGLPAEGGEEQRERVADLVQAQVAELLTDHPGRWSFAAQWGTPVDVLEEQADEVGAYVVVVGAPTGGLGAAVERLLTGSTSRGLERRGSRPVLVVPPR